jgi:hypothetical protein
MAFLEKTRITGELICQLLPGIIRINGLKEFPVFLDWCILTDGHQLDGPKQDLSKVTDQFIARINCRSRHK